MMKRTARCSKSCRTIRSVGRSCVERAERGRFRWGASGRGKSGGVRVIYFYSPAPVRCYMLFIFAKNEQSDLKSEQHRLLRDYIQQHLK